jgi:hypothetical protein
MKEMKTDKGIFIQFHIIWVLWHRIKFLIKKWKI